jgi:hypothetical protein
MGVECGHPCFQSVGSSERMPATVPKVNSGLDGDVSACIQHATTTTAPGPRPGAVIVE